MVRKKRPDFNNLPLESREAVAENMKERVYSTITLLAVLVEMWRDGNHSNIGAIGAIVGAVVAIWLATLIANRLSYRAVHGKPIGRREYVRTFYTASGLLAPAIAPIVLIVISWVTKLYDLESALVASIVISLLSLFAFSFVAGRKIYDSLLRLLVVSALEMSVGFVVILLKLAVGK
jgi:hypothetical protein